MLNRRIISITFIAAATLGCSAHAATFAFKFVGAGVSGIGRLSYAPNPNTGVLPGTSPNPVDPIGSLIVTGITGHFTDLNLGVDAAITGIVPSNPAHPEPTNLLAPHSFGFYPIVNGVPNPGGTAPGLSYDDLFYPGGSPQTASDYMFHGGFLDIYGLVFTIAGGDAVNLWSNGDFGGGSTYGVGVTNGTDAIDYVGGVALTAVPEPTSWALLVAGFGLVGGALRGRARRVAAIAPPA